MVPSEDEEEALVCDPPAVQPPRRVSSRVPKKVVNPYASALPVPTPRRRTEPKDTPVTGVSYREMKSAVSEGLIKAIKEKDFASQLSSAFGSQSFEKVFLSFDNKVLVPPSKNFLTDERRKAAARATEVFGDTKGRLEGTLKVKRCVCPNHGTTIYDNLYAAIAAFRVRLPRTIKVESP